MGSKRHPAAGIEHRLVGEVNDDISVIAVEEAADRLGGLGEVPAGYLSAPDACRGPLGGNPQVDLGAMGVNLLGPTKKQRSDRRNSGRGEVGKGCPDDRRVVLPVDQDNCVARTQPALREGSSTKTSASRPVSFSRSGAANSGSNSR